MGRTKFVSMFPLPPDRPEGKSGDEILFLNPITEMPDMLIDYGITDAALFVLHPNESKKWNDGFMLPYNYINMVDAIDLQGAKCNLDWQSKILTEVKKIHAEFYIGGLSYRTVYLERYNYTPVEEVAANSVITIGGRDDPDVPSMADEFEITSPIIVNPLTPIIINTQPDVIKIEAPANAYNKPCSPVMGVTTAKFPPETRKWIHHLRFIHPLIDEKMYGLMLFEPVSEHMGENVITYNSDVYAVDVHEWAQPTTTIKNLIDPYCTYAFPHAHVLREIIRERMIEEEPDEINYAWTKLNSWMHDCMTVEIDLTTEEGTGLWCEGTRDPREPHGVVYVNDIYHPIDYIMPIKIPVVDMLFAYLKDACQLVNHMYQIYNKVKAENRMTKYSPALIKSVTQNWSIYKTDSPTGGYEQAPIAVDFALGRWGYYGTEIFTYDWTVGVGLEIEETYPRKKLGSGTFNADLVGNKLTNTITDKVDNEHLIPEIELVKPPIV